uniref:hypothetical protein n=1 Tax=Algoriphagus sp. TaxID=1872435 RepID=UPI002583CB5E|nr:hypothetical protein [Algoriphagus sp.]
MELSLKEVFEASKGVLSEIVDLSDPDFRLEQVEFKKDEKIWDIVVSFLVANKNKPVGITPITFSFPVERVYKRLKIDENKEVLGIYMFSEAG